MQRTSIVTKQSHYARCPALELLYNSLCGPRAKTFGDPWTRPREWCLSERCLCTPRHIRLRLFDSALNAAHALSLNMQLREQAEYFRTPALLHLISNIALLISAGSSFRSVSLNTIATYHKHFTTTFPRLITKCYELVW